MLQRSLEGTSFEHVYRIFGVNGDDELCSKMTNFGIVCTVLVGLYSFFQPAPYGRHSSDIFGPKINAKVGWMIQECMSLVLPLIIVLSTPGAQLNNYANILALSLFLLHYLNRSFIYPLTFLTRGKSTPIIVVLSAFVFTTYNGFLQGHHLANVYKVEDSFSLFTGTIIFLTGMIINISHDRMLSSLRKTSQKDITGPSSKTEYKIPRGGLFEYVSGANYFGEIIEWIGLALATRQPPQIVFAVFTLIFLGFRAVHHHRFYKDKFGRTYPKSRKAILPFVL